MWGQKTEYFYKLSPEEILNSIDDLGLKTTGRCLTLNSMENRVYEIEVYNEHDDGTHFVIAKFYRPGRWSFDQILEEHQFLFELENNDIPVVPPLRFNDKSLFTSKSEIFFSLFPKKGGRAPYDLKEEELIQLGRFIGRIHQVGSQYKFKHRLTLTPEAYLKDNQKYLLENNIIPEQFQEAFDSIFNQLFTLIEPLFKNIKEQRIHGDNHWGNILWREDHGPHFIDFDDVINGPIIQDLWLIIPGNDEEALRNREHLFQGYKEWGEIPHSELKLIEPLRALRLIHFAGWIARRWDDPAFPKAFPYFGTDRYWGELLNDLRSQLSLIQDAQTQSQDYSDYSDYKFWDD